MPQYAQIYEDASENQPKWEQKLIWTPFQCVWKKITIEEGLKYRMYPFML